MRTRVSYDEAVTMTLADVERLDGERVALAAACGRIAATDLRAPFDLPGFANSAMDGYAVRGIDLERAADTGLPVATTILAGDTRAYALDAGTAMAIMTGAPMPEGADTVVIQEQARREHGRVWLPADARVGGNVRSADDDCAAGTPILSAGEALMPARLALLAAFGQSRVDVVRRPRVAVLTTGDELVEADRPLGYGQRHDSNGPLLAALLGATGAEVLAVTHCGDDPSALIERLHGLCRPDVDLVLTCGGVSAGEADHLPAAIQSLGEVRFWKIRMKPGMPALHGRIGRTRVFALPGNPVSVGVTFQVLVRPLIDALLGRSGPRRSTMQVRLAAGWGKRHARLEFLRCTLTQDGQGTWLATPVAHQGSGALSMLAFAEALIRLDEGERDYQAGDLVEAQWLSGLNE